MSNLSTGVVNATEAYSKNDLMKRLGISQRFWDKMLDEGLPYTNVGHSRWVRGQDVLNFLAEHSVRKNEATAPQQPEPG
ncbi:MAG: topoisomerase II [Planctomycetota bacterium]|nr:topoisomerase II [Planctomycetota bacterium]